MTASGTTPDLFDLGDGKVVCFNPGGRFHGWLFLRHPDGDLVSIRQLNRAPTPPSSPVSRLLDRAAACQVRPGAAR